MGELAETREQNTDEWKSELYSEISSIRTSSSVVDANSQVLSGSNAVKGQQSSKTIYYACAITFYFVVCFDLVLYYAR